MYVVGGWTEAACLLSIPRVSFETRIGVWGPVVVRVVPRPLCEGELRLQRYLSDWMEIVVKMFLTHPVPKYAPPGCGVLPSRGAEYRVDGCGGVCSSRVCSIEPAVGVYALHPNVFSFYFFLSWAFPWKFLSFIQQYFYLVARFPSSRRQTPD
jgi:hypothetical protein